VGALGTKNRMLYERTVDYAARLQELRALESDKRRS